MLSYHNDPALKAKYVGRMQAHVDADELIRGSGWNKKTHKGCAVGCTFDEYDVTKFPDVLGIPQWAGQLLDTLHENVSKDYRVKGQPLALAFLQAIKPGVDLTKTEHLIHLFMLRGNLDRVQGLEIDAALKTQIIGAINSVIDVRQRAFDFGWGESAAWSAESAESAAWSAAWSAARSAARSAASAARSAESAAWSAAWSAASAAWSAESAAWSAESAARSAESAARSAESAANDAIANEFIRLLEAA